MHQFNLGGGYFVGIFTLDYLYMQGNILYRFPSLQRTAAPQRSGRKEYVGRKWADLVEEVGQFFKEKKLQFRYSFSLCFNMVIMNLILIRRLLSAAKLRRRRGLW